MLELSRFPLGGIMGRVSPLSISQSLLFRLSPGRITLFTIRALYDSNERPPEDWEALWQFVQFNVKIG
jgi:hypothetical protein